MRAMDRYRPGKRDDLEVLFEFRHGHLVGKTDGRFCQATHPASIFFCTTNNEIESNKSCPGLRRKV